MQLTSRATLPRADVGYSRSHSQILLEVRQIGLPLLPNAPAVRKLPTRGVLTPRRRRTTATNPCGRMPMSRRSSFHQVPVPAEDCRSPTIVGLASSGRASSFPVGQGVSASQDATSHGPTRCALSARARQQSGLSRPCHRPAASPNCARRRFQSCYETRTCSFRPRGLAIAGVVRPKRFSERFYD